MLKFKYIYILAQSKRKGAASGARIDITNSQFINKIKIIKTLEQKKTLIATITSNLVVHIVFWISIL